MSHTRVDRRKIKLNAYNKTQFKYWFQCDRRFRWNVDENDQTTHKISHSIQNLGNSGDYIWSVVDNNCWSKREETRCKEVIRLNVVDGWLFLRFGLRRKNTSSSILVALFDWTSFRFFFSAESTSNCYGKQNKKKSIHLSVDSIFGRFDSCDGTQ